MIITPKRRLCGVAAPGSIRRFSPDGRYIVVFSMDQTTVLLYELKYGWGKCATFDDFFTLHRAIRIPLTENELLCRDFCLFTADHKYMIVASASPSTDRTLKNPWINPRSMTVFEHLDNVAFHLISTKNYAILDKICFVNDFIMLANHGGVSLRGDQFAVCSLQHQSIILYRVLDDRFVITGRIGQYCDLSRMHANDSGLVMGFWHKFLRHLHYKSTDKNWFHSVSKSLSSLCIHKVQFIDSDRLLIRLVPLSFLAQRTSTNEHPTHFIFVIYSLRDNTVLDVYSFNNFLPWLLENDHLLRQSASEDPDITMPSFTDCHDTLYSLTRHLDSVKGNKRTNTLRKLLYTIPYSPQSHSNSTLIDQSRFRFDEKYIGREIKWRTSPDYPIRFIHREHESLAFTVEPWAEQQPASATSFKRFHSICWHPHLPFLIISHQSALRTLDVDIYFY